MDTTNVERRITITCSEWAGGPEYGYESHAHLIGEDAAYDWLVAAVKRTQDQARGIKRISVIEPDRAYGGAYEIRAETVPGCDKTYVDFSERPAQKGSVDWLSVSEQQDDPMDAHYGTNSAAMIASIRRNNGMCIECGRNQIDRHRREGNCFVCGVRLERAFVAEHESQAAEEVENFMDAYDAAGADVPDDARSLTLSVSTWTRIASSTNIWVTFSEEQQLRLQGLIDTAVAGHSLFDKVGIALSPDDFDAVIDGLDNFAQG